MLLVRRLIHIAAILPALSFALFVLLHVMPGSPEEMILASNPSLRPSDIERIRQLRALDRPIIDRYVCWWVGRRDRVCAWWPGGRGLLRGDLGYSRVHGRPVFELVGERLPRTLTLMLPAFVLAFLLSLILGALSARYRGRFPDRLVSGLGFVGLAMPLHWLSMVGILVFAVELRWLPTSGIDSPRAPGLASRLHHAILPMLVMTLFYTGRWLRYVRGGVAETLSAPFVRVLRARGLSEPRVLAHALRSALLPVVTAAGQSLPTLFSGAVVIERVFVYPGMGALILESVLADDHLVAIVVLLGYAAVTLCAALATDAALMALDPRLREPVGHSRLS